MLVARVFRHAVDVHFQIFQFPFLFFREGTVNDDSLALKTRSQSCRVQKLKIASARPNHKITETFRRMAEFVSLSLFVATN